MKKREGATNATKAEYPVSVPGGDLGFAIDGILSTRTISAVTHPCHLIRSTNWGKTMVDTFVFHLMKRDAAGLLRQVVVFRFAYDDRITVKEEDPWRLIAADGEVTDHRVAELRTFYGIHGEELHVFMKPVYEVTAR